MNNPLPTQKPASKTVRNLVYFFYLTNGMPPAKKRIIDIWDRHPVLRRHKRPPIAEVDGWCREWMKEEIR